MKVLRRVSLRCTRKNLRDSHYFKLPECVSSRSHDGRFARRLAFERFSGGLDESPESPRRPEMCVQFGQLSLSVVSDFNWKRDNDPMSIHPCPERQCCQPGDPVGES